jgi:hypothetical protein
MEKTAPSWHLITVLGPSSVIVRTSLAIGSRNDSLRDLHKPLITYGDV